MKTASIVIEYGKAKDFFTEKEIEQLPLGAPGLVISSVKIYTDGDSTSSTILLLTGAFQAAVIHMTRELCARAPDNEEREKVLQGILETSDVVTDLKDKLISEVYKDAV